MERYGERLADAGSAVPASPDRAADRGSSRGPGRRLRRPPADLRRSRPAVREPGPAVSASMAWVPRCRSSCSSTARSKRSPASWGSSKREASTCPSIPPIRAERIAWILEDCKAPVVVTTSDLAGRLPNGTSAVLLDPPPWRPSPDAGRVDREREGTAASPITPPTSSTPPARPAGPRASSSSTARW